MVSDTLSKSPPSPPTDKRVDCGTCSNCQDMVKYGGSHKKKQKCLLKLFTPEKKATADESAVNHMNSFSLILSRAYLQVTPDAKPEAKPDSKPEANPAAKPEAKPDSKPAAKPDSKPAAKPDSKPEAKSAAKPVAKPEAKLAAKPEANPAAKPAAKPVTKPVTKPAAKQAAKSSPSTLIDFLKPTILAKPSPKGTAPKQTSSPSVTTLLSGDPPHKSVSQAITNMAKQFVESLIPTAAAVSKSKPKDETGKDSEVKSNLPASLSKPFEVASVLESVGSNAVKQSSLALIAVSTREG